MRIVKAYGQEADQITRAGSTIDTLLNYTMRSVRARAASPAIEMLAGIAIGVIIFYGGYQSTQGNLTAGEFMGFISALLMAYQPLRPSPICKPFCKKAYPPANAFLPFLTHRTRLST
ncbi:MAG: hypothetical protein CM15mP55_0760 [Hyphomicrobiales bacterium]|nr:MAG: hypothetical protein CM15mP55_0760 [Hyphomicrobiales bacterium]